MTPFEAYRHDLDRLDQRSDGGGADTVWLLVAHCMGRLGRVKGSDRRRLAAQSAEALRDLQDPDASRTGRPADHDLVGLIEGLPGIEDRDGADLIARSVRGLALRMSEAGALRLAWTVLDTTRATVTATSDREQALLATEQARCSRLLGELDVADELYRHAATAAERSADPEVLSRCALGRGVLARIRGNYPRARAFFSEGLRLAHDARARELEYFAEQGLTIVCAVAGDFDGAISHGWSTFRLGGGNQTKEAESLTNLAEVCLLAGYPAAALRAFLAALARTTVMRVRLPALAGAALAAGRAGDAPRLARLTDEIQMTAERAALPYETAEALCSLSAACLAVNDQVGSERHRQSALRIAMERGFHEIALKAERSQVAGKARGVEGTRLAPDTSALVAGLERYEPEADETAFALRRPG